MYLKLLFGGKLLLFLLINRWCFHDEVTAPEDTIHLSNQFIGIRRGFLFPKLYFIKNKMHILMTKI